MIDMLDFSAYLNTIDLQFDVIGLSETWFNGYNVALYSFDGYMKVDKYRDDKRGGGVSILIKQGKKYELREDLSVLNDNAEMRFVELNKEEVHMTKNVIVGVVYRPPNTDIDFFKAELNKQIETLNRENKKVYIMGTIILIFLMRKRVRKLQNL